MVDGRRDGFAEVPERVLEERRNLGRAGDSKRVPEPGDQRGAAVAQGGIGEVEEVGEDLRGGACSEGERAPDAWIEAEQQLVPVRGESSAHRGVVQGAE